MVQLLQTLNPHSKKVLVRTEFDVPIKDGEVTETARIEDAIPTIKFLLRGLGRVILISHMGRPEKVDPELSLKPCVPILEKLLGVKVGFVNSSIGSEAAAAVTALKDGEVLLLENLRFNPGEEAKDEAFGKELAALGEIYVNEAFGVSHRDHASMSFLPEVLPSYAGLRLNLELDNLNKAVKHIERPFIFIFGGKKADTKLKLLPDIAKLADTVLLGGTMFMEDFAHLKNVVVPDDVVIGKQLGTGWEKKVTDWTGTEPVDGWSVYDVGPKTSKKYGDMIREAKTVGWNGPLGWFEQKYFETGTKELVQQLAFAQAFTLAGGGDSKAALDQFKLADKLDFVSTGGGAMLEFIAGHELPALKALGYYD